MLPAHTNRLLADLSRRHHGLIFEPSARAAGISDSAIQRRVGSGLLERLDRQVLRMAGAPPTWRQRALAAVWVAGPEALLSHRAAALLWGLDGIEHAPFDVLTHRWARRTARSGTKVHEARDLIGADRHQRDAIPCTSIVRTLLDLPAVVHRFRADQAFEDALRRRLCTVDEVADRFVQVARRGRPGTVAMRGLIGKRLGAYVPTMSEFERRTSELAEAIGLPRPARQHPVDIGSTTVYLDLAWPGRSLAVECDGLFHHATDLQLPWDEHRQNELVLRGWLVLRFTWQQLTRSRDVVSQQLWAAYQRTATQLAQPVR
jgi:very-short-patch-repair endonuclease